MFDSLPFHALPLTNRQDSLPSLTAITGQSGSDAHLPLAPLSTSRPCIVKLLFLYRSPCLSANPLIFTIPTSPSYPVRCVEAYIINLFEGRVANCQRSPSFLYYFPSPSLLFIFLGSSSRVEKSCPSKFPLLAFFLLSTEFASE